MWCWSMPAHQSEWLIRPSRLQQRIDLACWLLGSILLLTAMDGGWKILFLIPLVGSLAALWIPRSPVLIGKNCDGWWLFRGGEKYAVTFKSGSVRRRQYVRLVWGFWPWQVLVIRPDSFQNAEPYRHLKYELYGAV